MKKIAIPVILGLLGTVPMTAGAQDMPQGKWWQTPSVADELKITDEEKAALDGKFHTTAGKLIDLKAGLEKGMLELEHMLDSGTQERKAILKQFDQVQAARQELSGEYFQFLLDAREILGSERFSQLKNRFKRLREERRRRGPGAGHMPPGHGGMGSQMKPPLGPRVP